MVWWGGLDAFCRRNTPPGHRSDAHHRSASHATVPPGPQACLSSNDTGAFLSAVCAAMSLWLADALVLQWKTKWAWKETMSLTLEDFMFSTSLSHQWIYEPGEEFPERKCHAMIPQNVTLGKGGRKKLEWPVIRSGNILLPFPSLIFYLEFFTDSIFPVTIFSLSWQNLDFILQIWPLLIIAEIKIFDLRVIDNF